VQQSRSAAEALTAPLVEQARWKSGDYASYVRGWRSLATVRAGNPVDLVAVVRVRVVTGTVVTVVGDACDDVRRGGLRVFA